MNINLLDQINKETQNPDIKKIINVLGDLNLDSNVLKGKLIEAGIIGFTLTNDKKIKQHK